ncbi:hypothetical protein NFHSH190041_26630 [Shewanella sp. NFH-SH190041]|uniref:PAS domain S-box protein n=1 Tax=Shewanella sp. NFH-SH190041 TaxID=2950245 RepID=UPI0021C361DD|nr:PAS domain S-box protein [Shewanella sp. NFH-SH190041]BDM65211.1 hypothetical protein NFHSH190041_26630 [Shewanella sp. NFH-SH190041]
MSFKGKLIILLLLVGALPIAAVYFQYSQNNATVRELVYSELANEAMVLSDLIDRNLFERYYDAQAFVLSLKGRQDPFPLPQANRRQISVYFDQLVRFYQIYRRIVLLSPQGEFLAGNHSSADGHALPLLAIDTDAIRHSDWFKQALTHGSHHTADSVPTVTAGPLTNPLYSAQEPNSYDMIFAFALRDENGHPVAVLVNLMDFNAIAQMVDDFHHLLQQQGVTHDDAMVLLDGSGRVLLTSDTASMPLSQQHHVATPSDAGLWRESTLPQVAPTAVMPTHVSQALALRGDNWAELQMPAALAAIAGQSGAIQGRFPGQSDTALIGYAHSQGAYDFHGTGWSVLIGRPVAVAFAANIAANNKVIWLMGGVILLILLASIIFGHRLAEELSALARAIAALSKNQLDSMVLRHRLTGEVQQAFIALDVLRHHLIYKNKLEQKNNEQRRELLLKDAAIDTATTGIVIADAQAADTPIIYANPAFYRTTGYDASETLGRNCRFLQGSDTDQPQIAEINLALKAGRSIDVVLKNYRKNGELYWNHLYISPVRNEDNVITHFVGIETDVSELKNYEQQIRELNLYLENRVQSRTLALQQAEHQLRATFDAMMDALVVVDNNGVIRQANRSTSTIFGFNTNELSGQNVAVLLSCDNKIVDMASWCRELAQTSSRRTAVLTELEAINKSGHIFPIELSVTAVHGGSLQGYTLVLRDISDRKAAEVRLRKARDDAEQANRFKSEFLGNMSHELRTPMNAVIGMTDLVLDSQLSAEQRRHLTTVSKSAHALLALLNEILDLTKLERGSMEIEQVTFELAPVVQAAVGISEVQAKGKGLSLCCELDSRLSTRVKGDPVRLRQVLVNLVGNAVKFTEQGEVNVFVIPAEDDKVIHFTVTDTGIGIAPDRLAHIFKPFVQSDGSISRRFGGTGLGTTISRELVEKMGGKIWVESEPEVGSKFHFTVSLPSCEAPVIESVSCHDATRIFQPTQSLNILLAEDIAVNAELIQTRLGRDGHRICWCQDGLQALHTYKKRSREFDLVLMDIHMPMMNGYQAAEEISRFNAEHGVNVPIIALTASGMGQDREKCRDVGMAGFVIKPVDFSQLTAVMAELLPQAFSETCFSQIQSEPASTIQQPLSGLSTLVDLDMALDNWGSEDKYLVMVRDFAVKWQHGAAEMTSLLQQDKHACSQLAHQLTGVAGGLGMMSLSHAARTLENAIKASASTESLLECAEQLTEQLSQILTAIALLPVLNQVITPAVEADFKTALPSRPLADVMAELEALKQALQRGTFDDTQLANVLQGLAGYLDRDVIAELATRVDEFDFEGAVSCIGRIAEALILTMEGLHE